MLRGRKGQLVPCFGGVEILMCLWIACAVLTLVASQQRFYIQGRYGKRQEPRADSFFVSGGRYGRNENPHRESKSLARLVEVVPRVERFFWASRCGKRSSLDYRTVASANRFGAVLDFIERLNRNREKDAGAGHDLDLLS